jgi:glucosamine 6-phosphate synthetase-like amidotransferase/phosphosugar isomerase protein
MLIPTVIWTGRRAVVHNGIIVNDLTLTIKEMI